MSTHLYRTTTEGTILAPRVCETSRLACLDVITCARDGCALHFGFNGLSRGGASADTIFCLSRARIWTLLASCKVQAFSLHVNVNKVLQQITTTPHLLQPTRTPQKNGLNLEDEQAGVLREVCSYQALIASRTHVLFVAGVSALPWRWQPHGTAISCSGI
jgi:hypothetical protein